MMLAAAGKRLIISGPSIVRAISLRGAAVNINGNFGRALSSAPVGGCGRWEAEIKNELPSRATWCGRHQWLCAREGLCC